MIAKILFVTSGMLWAGEMIPQLIKTYKRKSVEDISIYFPMICIISFILYFIASYLTKNWILILSTSMPFICNIIFFTQILIYRKRRGYKIKQDPKKCRYCKRELLKNWETEKGCHWCDNEAS